MSLTSWEKLVNEIQQLPNITKKNAEQIAYHLLKQNQQTIKQLITTISLAQTTLRLCQECNNIAEEIFCHICQDKNRKKILIVVESPLEILKFEKIDHPKTYYHVLGGLLDLHHQENTLNIDSLKKRSSQYQEIVLALSPTLNGIMTFNYLKDALKHKNVTQLAQGMPIGASLSYVDPLTLKAALDNRKGWK